MSHSVGLLPDTQCRCCLRRVGCGFYGLDDAEHWQRERDQVERQRERERKRTTELGTLTARANHCGHHRTHQITLFLSPLPVSSFNSSLSLSPHAKSGSATRGHHCGEPSTHKKLKRKVSLLFSFSLRIHFFLLRDQHHKLSKRSSPSELTPNTHTHTTISILSTTVPYNFQYSFNYCQPCACVLLSATPKIVTTISVLNVCLYIE